MTWRSRARRLGTKFISSPLLPVLGWTKVVETVVSGGALASWVVYAGLITVVWVAGEELQRRLQDAVEEVSDA